MSKTWIGKWKRMRIGGIEAMWRVRAEAEVPRRAADGGRPNRAKRVEKPRSPLQPVK